MVLRAIHVLPLCIFVLLPLTFIATYIISVLLKHVEVGFPYISDTGTYHPESNIFAQLLNIASFLLAATVYVRFKQIEQYHRDHLSAQSCRLLRINTSSLWLGWISCIGMSIVANFQETEVFAMHILGAGLLFTIGTIYLWLQTVMSFYMYPLLNTRRVARLRLTLCIILTVTFITTFLFAGLALNRFHGKDKTKWYPKDGGYVFHVISSASEWAMALCFDLYLLTFVREFQRFSLDSPKVLFTMDELGLPSHEIYSSEDQVEITQSQNGNVAASPTSSLSTSMVTTTVVVH